MAKKGNGGFTRYTTYNWTDYDPILDVIDALQKQANMSDAEITARTRVGRSTRKNWRTRKVKCPRFNTAAAVAVCLGIDHLPITAAARRQLKDSFK